MKDIKQEDEARYHKKTQPLYDQLKAPDEGMLDFQVEPLADSHATLLADVQSDEQRANLATQLQQSYGNAYVQQVMERIQVEEGSGRAFRGSAFKASGEALKTKIEPVPTPDVKISLESVPVLNDITPTTSSGLTRISLSDVDIQGEVYEDGDDWKIRVTSASATIHWGINSTGYTIPNPVDGGNITEANYKTVVSELQGYAIRQYASNWHHPAASIAHELNHVEWYKSEIERTWPAIKAQIESYVLGSVSSTSTEEAITNLKRIMDMEIGMATYLQDEERKWFNAYVTALEIPAYAAGQTVLNTWINAIQSYANSKGWK